MRQTSTTQRIAVSALALALGSTLVACAEEEPAGTTENDEQTYLSCLENNGVDRDAMRDETGDMEDVFLEPGADAPTGVDTGLWKSAQRACVAQLPEWPDDTADATTASLRRLPEQGVSGAYGPILAARVQDLSPLGARN